MIALARHPAERGKVCRKGCRDTSAWVVSMLVYIEMTLHKKNGMFAGVKVDMFSKAGQSLFELFSGPVV
jgi:hypothetical protein